MNRTLLAVGILSLSLGCNRTPISQGTDIKANPTDASKEKCVQANISENCRDNWCRIPKTCFRMGSPIEEKCRNVSLSRETQHIVRLDHTLELMQTEVTQYEFENLMGYNISTFKNCKTCPVDNINWHVAAEYCNKLSINNGLGTCYECIGKNKIVCSIKKEYDGKKFHTCPGYRLPTEAEWEHAYRSGTESAFYNGRIESCEEYDTNASSIGWYIKNSTKTKTVKLKNPNSLGLYDIAGNVWEWVNDWYQNDLGKNEVVDPYGPLIGKGKVLKGGSWKDGAYTLRGAMRMYDDPTVGFSNYGFRCARTMNQ